MPRCIAIGGAPGSGKSTLGKYLSLKLGYKFLDIDEIASQFTPKLKGKELWSKYLEVVNTHFLNKQSIVLSATFIERLTRNKIVADAYNYGFNLKLYFITAEKELLLRRCKEREINSHVVNTDNSVEIIEKWFQKHSFEENSDLGNTWKILNALDEENITATVEKSLLTQ